MPLACLRLLRTIALAVFAANAACAHAATVFLDELTSVELAARVRDGATTVLIPIGGTEQNGAHIALGKHNARARLLAQRIANELGNAIVAPVIAYVPEGRIDRPTAHMRYAGTLSVSDAAFEQVLEGAARSLRRHGFRDIAFLGDHGGYQKDEALVASRLTREWSASGTHVLAVPEYYRAASAGFAKLLRTRGYSEAEIGTHAGLADTALTLALDPALVRSDALVHGASVPGVEGDPARATAALGELGVDLIVRDTVTALRKATRR